MLRLVLSLLLLASLTAGCNTIAGVGKDLEKAGETIQRKAK
jgi:predicted small secreted protein